MIILGFMLGVGAFWLRERRYRSRNETRYMLRADTKDRTHGVWIVNGFRNPFHSACAKCNELL